MRPGGSALLNRAFLRVSGRPLFSLLLLRQMVSDDTSANRADNGVMTRIVTRDTADHGTLQTAGRGSRTCETRQRKSQQNERTRRFLHDDVSV